MNGIPQYRYKVIRTIHTSREDSYHPTGVYPTEQMAKESIIRMQENVEKPQGMNMSYQIVYCENLRDI